MIEDFWADFLKNTGRDASTPYLECFHFDLNERSANELLELVLSGRKRATASSLYYFEKSNVKLPEPGDLSIVTDWNGTPRCVIRTEDVQILPFQDVTFELCKWEGEDDCLESWQIGHTRFFTEEGNEVGYRFSEEMPVVFEKFSCIYSI
jgi:uncharacterized protein YhfF